MAEGPVSEFRGLKANWSDALEETQGISSLREEEEEAQEEEEDDPPIPMKTRLRKQVGREREREREQRMPETISISDGEEDVGQPSQLICESRLAGGAFSYQAPLLWNQLSLWVWESDTISTLKA
ncbi:unnamed protein product [Pleuronectes platessa]|uniref:Uncharacterized protein n=1 Tax=Pleuronectes platessa TaxID=8262 RepID=A0A9N7TP58_PLEPL|nr:unnamed protein product [Pleuronectes platessa]